MLIELMANRWRLELPLRGGLLGVADLHSQRHDNSAQDGQETIELKWAHKAFSI